MEININTENKELTVVSSTVKEFVEFIEAHTEYKEYAIVQKINYVPYTPSYPPPYVLYSKDVPLSI